MPITLTPERIDQLIASLNAPGAIAAADAADLAGLLRAMGATIAAQHSQIDDLTETISMLSDEQDANAHRRVSVLTGLSSLAPPRASIDVDAADRHARALGEELARGRDLTRAIAAAARFAVAVAARFV